jgi:serine/threonine protein kinase
MHVQLLVQLHAAGRHRCSQGATMSMNPTPPDQERTLSLPSDAKEEAKLDAEKERGNPALPTGTRLAEFEITGLIGIGGFGIVYQVYDHSLQRTVALKEYMPSALAMRDAQSHVALSSPRHREAFQAGLRSFVNEARLLAQFDHPSLVKVYRFWEDDGTAYMVMPYYQGLTLKQTLAQRAAPPDETWLKNLLAPLLDALEVIHREHCFHRDIAPDNILMLEDGRPLLLDFGAARRAIGGITQAFTVILKQGYAPIEQYAEIASMKQGPWTDIYALGSVVHFAITGSAPTPAVARMVSDPQIPLSIKAAGRYGAAFLKAIDQALAVKPEDRPHSVAELRSLLGLEPTVATPALPPTNPSAANGAAGKQASDRIWGLEWKQYARVLTVAATVTTVATLITSAYFFSRKTPSPADIEASKPGITALPLQQPPSMAIPFDPIQVLDSIFQARNRDHAVTVSVEKAQVQIGKDRLHFSIRSSKPGYVYLLMVGTDRSQFWLLFPNAIDNDNAIAAGKQLDLPRAGWRMGAEGPAGTDQFVVMVSDSPRDFQGAGLKDRNPFAEFPLTEAARLQRAHGGPVPVFAGKASCHGTRTDACSASFGAAVFSIEEIDAQ